MLSTTRKLIPSILFAVVIISSCQSTSPIEQATEEISPNEPITQASKASSNITPTATSKPTEIVPTETSTKLPQISQSDIVNKWRIPIVSISIVGGACDSALQLFEKIQSGEIGGLESLGEILAVGILVKSAEEVIVDWSSFPDQIDYKRNIQNHVDNIQSLLGQWMDDEVPPEEVSAILSDECNAVMQSGKGIIQTARDDGLTEESLTKIIEDLEAALDELASGIEEISPTATSEPPSSAESPIGPKGDGFYTVSEEISPGKWESEPGYDLCYWARLNDKQEILDNYVGHSGGTVNIQETDFEVEFSRCGTFYYMENLDRELATDAGEPKGDGFYTVGVEILPGKWESEPGSDLCYWARLDEKQEILNNHVGYSGGTVYIRETDYEVEFSDCGTFKYVENLDRELATDAGEPKGDGFYTVGVEILPGKWESESGHDLCYWVRFDDKQNIIDNHIGLSGGIVTIQESDYEVGFSDCGTWIYKGP